MLSLLNEYRLNGGSCLHFDSMSVLGYRGMGRAGAHSVTGCQVLSPLSAFVDSFLTQSGCCLCASVGVNALLSLTPIESRRLGRHTKDHGYDDSCVPFDRDHHGQRHGHYGGAGCGGALEIPSSGHAETCSTGVQAAGDTGGWNLNGISAVSAGAAPSADFAGAKRVSGNHRATAAGDGAGFTARGGDGSERDAQRSVVTIWLRTKADKLSAKRSSMGAWRLSRRYHIGP